MEASTFVPSHITGFFEIFLDDLNPLKCGSRGGGFCINKGVQTKVIVEYADKQNVHIEFNGSPAPPASTSRRVIDLMIGKEPFDVRVDTRLDLPESQGLGISGAGALSTAVALNRALDMGHSSVDLVCFAHQAEVESRTGLGDVIAQSRGGLELRSKPGAPPFGEVKSWEWDQEILLVIFEPPLSTRQILTSPALQSRINSLGRAVIDDFESDPTPETFLSLAKDFTAGLALASDKVINALESIPDEYRAGMAMLGNCVYIAGKNAHSLDGSFPEAAQTIKVEVYNKSTEF